LLKNTNKTLPPGYTRREDGSVLGPNGEDYSLEAILRGDWGQAASAGGGGTQPPNPPGVTAGFEDDDSNGTGQSFDSFNAFKKAMGAAGQNQQWHHIVEQNPTNAAQFGQRALQNTNNLVPLNTTLHRQISGFYSSIRPDVTGSTTLTVRQWVSSQSFDTQMQFGQEILNKVLGGIVP